MTTTNQIIININFENWGLDTIPTLFICIFLPLMVYFSYWLFFTGIIGLHRMHKSKKWKHCIGKITDAEIRYKKFSNGSDVDIDFKFVLVKTYEYIVDDVKFQSSQTYASDSLYEKEFKPMSKFPKRYKEYYNSLGYQKAKSDVEKMIGKKTTVYYNPKNPKKACLINKIHKEIFLPIIMGLLFGSGLTVLVFYFLNIII